MEEKTTALTLKHYISYVGFGGDFSKIKEIEVNKDFNPYPLPKGFIGFFTYDKIGNEIHNQSHKTFIWPEENVITVKSAKHDHDYAHLFADKFGKLMKYDDETYIIFNENGSFIVLNEADIVLSLEEP